MFKGLWRSVVRWWRSLLGESPRRAAVAATELPPLTDPDYEYLFMQLLEGVAHGWQQPRVIKFFHKVKQRAPKSQWLAWINGFGYRLVNSPAPNEELARKMIQLSELDCGEVTHLAGEFGHQLLSRIYGNMEEFLPEFIADDLPELDYAAWGLETAQHDSLSVAIPLESLTLDTLDKKDQGAEGFSEATFSHEETYAQDADNLAEKTPGDLPIFGEVPPELRIPTKPSHAPSPSLGVSNPLVVETRQQPPGEDLKIAETSGSADAQELPGDQQIAQGEVIPIEQFAMLLQENPERLQEIAHHLGLETTDPQLVLDGVIALMQQQIQDGK